MDESNEVRQKGDAIPLITSVGPELPEPVVKISTATLGKMWNSVRKLFERREQH